MKDSEVQQFIKRCIGADGSDTGLRRGPEFERKIKVEEVSLAPGFRGNLP
ncbi:MAG TPA: hypothetical protein VLK89_00750 [Solirubrobacterales bacterium]|nr:hypothetical protein [Solirubrobacterales bacterium]